MKRNTNYMIKKKTFKVKIHARINSQEDNDNNK